MPNDTPAVTPKKSDWMEICTRWVHIKKGSNFPLLMNCIPNFSSGWEPSSLYLGDPRKGKQCMQVTRWSWLWPLTAKPGMDGIKPHVRETWQYWSVPSLLTDVPLQMPFWTGAEIMIAELCPWRQIHPQPESAFELPADCAYAEGRAQQSLHWPMSVLMRLITQSPPQRRQSKPVLSVFEHPP